MVGVTFCVVEFSYFGLCKVPCGEGLRSTWGTSQGEAKPGARDKILDTKVARRACAGQTFPQGRTCGGGAVGVAGVPFALGGPARLCAPLTHSPTTFCPGLLDPCPFRSFARPSVSHVQPYPDPLRAPSSSRGGACFGIMPLPLSASPTELGRLPLARSCTPSHLGRCAGPLLRTLSWHFVVKHPRGMAMAMLDFFWGGQGAPAPQTPLSPPHPPTPRPKWETPKFVIEEIWFFLTHPRLGPRPPPLNTPFEHSPAHAPIMASDAEAPYGPSKGTELQHVPCIGLEGLGPLRGLSRDALRAPSLCLAAVPPDGKCQPQWHL